MRHTVLIALCSLLLGGCLPIEEIRYDSAVRPPKQDIEVFHDGRIPSRYCKEITSYVFNGNTGDQAKAERAFIERAKTNGADGLVIFQPQLVDPNPKSDRRIYKASAIVFGFVGAEGFADPAHLFSPSAFAAPVHISEASSTATARPDADAPFRVARICEEGSQRRLAFFDSSIEYLQHQNASTYRADIEELKHLRGGEIGLQRELTMFRRYVVEGKPWLMTDDETTQCLSDSRDRSAYFLRNLDMVKNQRSEGKITEADYNAESAFISMLADEDDYLQKVLLQFSADKLAYEQRLKAGNNQQPAIGVAPASNGESTFQKLLSLAILAKSLQNQQPTVVVIKRN